MPGKYKNNEGTQLRQLRNHQDALLVADLGDARDATPFGPKCLYGYVVFGEKIVAETGDVGTRAPSTNISSFLCIFENKWSTRLRRKMVYPLALTPSEKSWIRHITDTFTSHIFA